MIDFKTFWNTLVSLPIPSKIVSVLALAAIVLAILLSSCSCGQLVKVSVKGTPDGVTISTTQTKKDSSALDIKVNPTLNFNK